MIPWRWGNDNEMRELTNGEICAVLGNAICWQGIEGNGTVEVDTMWRSTPMILWGEIPNEVFGTYDTIDMKTYDFGASACEEIREEESGCQRVEFLEEMGMKPPGKWVSSSPDVFSRVNRECVSR